MSADELTDFGNRKALMDLSDLATLDADGESRREFPEGLDFENSGSVFELPE
jgi:hypothetical protein